MSAEAGSSGEFEVILGTYENFVLGYSFDAVDENRYKLTQTFASKAHLASVRTVACGGKFLASGSADETIQLFNLKSRKEMGSLMKHQGTVNSVRFFDSSYLFSASDDGTIGVWNTGSWMCLKTLKGHKAAVTDLAVHSSGKMLLSVSRDKSLYTWNLVKGRPAFITNIKVDASLVSWTPVDGYFVVVHARNCNIYSTEVGGTVGSIDFGNKISALAFISEYLVLSGEEGKVSVFDLSVKDDVGHVAPSCILEFEADKDKKRIKGVAYAGPAFRMGCHYIVTATSEGSISVWLVNVADSSDKPKLMANTTSGCRITACTVYRAGE